MTLNGSAKSFFEAMKTQPLALALAMIIMVLLYFIWDIRKEEVKARADFQRQVNEMVTKFCGGRPS